MHDEGGEWPPRTYVKVKRRKEEETFWQCHVLNQWTLYSAAKKILLIVCI